MQSEVQAPWLLGSPALGDRYALDRGPCTSPADSPNRSPGNAGSGVVPVAIGAPVGGGVENNGYALRGQERADIRQLLVERVAFFLVMARIGGESFAQCVRFEHRYICSAGTELLLQGGGEGRLPGGRKIRGPEERSLRKSPDSNTILGPWLVTADEIPNHCNFDPGIEVNGLLPALTRASARSCPET